MYVFKMTFYTPLSDRLIEQSICTSTSLSKVITIPDSLKVQFHFSHKFAGQFEHRSNTSRLITTFLVQRRPSKAAHRFASWFDPGDGNFKFNLKPPSFLHFNAVRYKYSFQAVLVQQLSTTITAGF